MSTLNLAARYYLFATWATGLLILALLGPAYAQVVTQWPILLLGYLAFTVADYFEVNFEIQPGNRLSMTIADAPMMFLVAIAGPIGIVSVVLGSLTTDSLRRRPWFKTLFNASMRSVTYIVMALCYQWMQPAGTLPFGGPWGLVTFGTIAGIYYLCNTIQVSTIIALASNQPLIKLYFENVRDVHLIHFATIPFGALMAILWSIDIWTALLGILPLIMLYRWYQTIAALQLESKRNRELAQESTGLARKLERLQSTTTAMMSASATDLSLQTMTGHLANMLGAETGWVRLFDRTHSRIVSSRTLPFPLESTSLFPPSNVNGLEPWVLHGPAIDQLAPGVSAYWNSIAILPLMLEQRLLGEIFLASTQPIDLAIDDRRVLMAFAAQAAITIERGQLFQELQTKQNELIRSSKLAALGTFAAGIGHEFNNLLASISGYAQLGLSSNNIHEKDEALEVAVRACSRGKSITSGLLTFARHRESQREPFYLAEVVEETIVMIERELAKDQIIIRREFAPIPDVMGDSGQIAQVVLNLLTNARDALRDTGGGTITVQINKTETHAVLKVTDTGSGIPPEIIDQVFQPFFTTKGALNGSRTPGTGLGLAVTYGIIESHNGTIQISSVLQQGTTFTITLPLLLDELSIAQENNPEISRVLIVDNEIEMANPLRRMLQEKGWQTQIATQVEDALQLLQHEEFDLVISDAQMPGISGGALVRRLREMDPGVQVLVMTGHTNLHQLDYLRNDGVIGVIAKPFSLDSLLKVLQYRPNPKAAPDEMIRTPSPSYL